MSGLFWTFSQQISEKFINLIIQILIARLLLPSDFGLLAMVIVFIAIGNSLSDGGLTSSLIRTTDVTENDYSSVFYLNIIVSIFIYFIFFFIAPLISIFYNEPILINVIRVFSFNLIIRAFVGVQTAILTKSFQFRKIMTIQVPSVIAGGAIGIFLGYEGYGVWSLVWLNLVQSIFLAIQYWIRSEWHPRIIMKWKLVKKHFSFGYKLMIASLLNSIFENIYNLLIGKWYTPLQLGYYNRADSFQSFPLRMIITALKSVAYPVLSSIQNDDDQLRIYYRKMILHVVFLVTPLMILLIIIAKPMFSLLLTDKWLPAVPYFQVLCLSSIFYPLQEYNLQILDVKGRSDLYLKIEIVKKVIIILAIAIAFQFGIYGLLFAQVILSIFFFFIGAFVCGKMIHLYVIEQLKIIFPILILSIVVGIFIWSSMFLLQKLDISNLVMIFLSSLIYFSIYLLFSSIFRIEALYDLKNIFKDYKTSHRIKF